MRARSLAAAAAVLCLCALARGGALATLPCAQLDAAYQRTKEGEVRTVASMWLYGEERWVAVSQGAAPPDRAAAALLAAVLRYGARVLRLQLLPPAPTTLCDLAQTMQYRCNHIDEDNSSYDNLILVPTIGWNGERCVAIETCLIRDVVPLRLQVTGGGAAPLHRRLHTALAPHVRNNPRCLTAASWDFYTNREALLECGFVTNNRSDTTATIWYATNSSQVNNTVTELGKRAAAASLHVSLQPLSSDKNLHSRVLDLVRRKNSSVLFLDYDIWENEPGIQVIQLPTCSGDNCENELDRLRSVRIADVLVLQEKAPQLLMIFKRFSPTPTQLREVLELEMERSDSDGWVDMEEAACKWAANNTSIFESWFQVESTQQYWIAVFLCDNDPDINEYKQMASVVAQFYSLKTTKFNISIYFKKNDCSSESDLGNKFIKETVSNKWRRLIGAVVSGAGAKMAAEYAPAMETALLVADVPGARLPLGRAVRAASGGLRALVNAIKTFVSFFKWKRLAILSEESELACDFVQALQYDSILTIRNIYLGTEIKPFFIVESLKSFRQAGARIFFVNSITNISKAILCLACELGMTPLNGYIWIVRDWHLYHLDCAYSSLCSRQMSFFTISYWWRGQDADAYLTNNGTNNNYLRKSLTEFWKDRLWPSLSVPITDALQLLIKSFEKFQKTHTTRLNDLHGKETVRLLLETIENERHDGLIQELHYQKGILAKNLVFVTQWIRNDSKIIAKWIITNETIDNVPQLRDIYDGDPPPDGSRICLTGHTGDLFEPHCHDKVWFMTASCLFLTILVLSISWRVRMRRLAKKDSILTAQLLAQREISSTVLANHLVDRAALDIYHDLGKGCFGRVRYGIFHAPDCLPVSVAVKDLHDDVALAEESELLSEAATLASLQNEHVVRLIGVCMTGGPLLVLMEYASYGNLQEYLSMRRHHAEDAADHDYGASDEAFHVSAESITRLAREAASALEYLALQRLVHRDVRSSNCLVDERRALKLADFGLARKTDAGAAGDEYLCRRHGLLPAMWMAPESLERGVFTPASDAWALGVLLLELVTLGARPYGWWPPMRVTRYVCAGGRPPLPIDMSLETRQLLLRCWRRDPEARLSAAETALALSRSPAALRPALAPPAPVLDEESPMPDDDNDYFVFLQNAIVQ